MHARALTVVTSFGLGIVVASCGQAGPSRPAATNSAEVYSIGLTVDAASALPNCTAALSGLVAFVASPANLFECSAGRWRPIDCTNRNAGAVAYASPTQTLVACVSGIWTEIAIPPGPPGQPGPAGDAGPPGAPGPQGPAGQTSLVLVSTELSGVNCALGGLRVDTGLDSNNDGTLEAGEVQHTAYACAVPAGGSAGAGGAPVDAGAGGKGGSAGSGTGGRVIVSCTSSPGALIDLEPLQGDSDSAGFGIDDRGIVLATSTNPSCPTCPGPRPFFWQPSLRNQLFGGAAGSIARVTAMNHAGRVVGADSSSCPTCFLAWNAPSPFPTAFGTGAAIDTAQVSGVGDNGAPFGSGRVQRGCSNCFHAIIWPPTLGNSVTDLGTVDGLITTGSTASAVNNFGQVVGSSGGRAVLWAPAIRDLGNLGTGGASAADINDATDVVGSSVTTSGKTHAFLWRAGAMQDLGTLQGGFSQAVAINGAGDVVGNSDGHGFLWRGGAMIDLGTLGGTSSTAVAINDAGQVTGNSQTAAGNTHPFLWQNGVMTDLGTLGGADSSAVAINASGLVVGTSNTATGNNHAFLACIGMSGGSGGMGGQAGGAGGTAGAGGGCPALTEYPLLSWASPGGLTAGPDDALWLTMRESVVRISTAGEVNVFPTTLVGPNPHMIVGPDGNLWYDTAQGLGRIDLADVITTFPTSDVPRGLTAGPDGNIWFTSTVPAARLDRMTPSGVVGQRALQAQPIGDLVYARDGFWTSTSTGVLRFDRTDVLNDSPGAPPAVAVSFPASQQPLALSAAPDGSVWFTTVETRPGGPATVGRIGPAGDLVEFPVSGVAARPAVAADGSAWTMFATPTEFVVAHITPSGTMRMCPVPLAAGGEIIIGPDQHIWFTESSLSQIATFTP